MAARGAEGARTTRWDVDTTTVIAVAIVAYALASVLHEGIGHGGACLLAGGQPRVVSTVHFDGTIDSRFVAAGGTIVNVLAGICFWLLFRAVPRGGVELRFFLWLSMTINLLQGAGYFLFSGVTGIGDWSQVIAGLSPPALWRAGLAALGAVSYWMLMRFAAGELSPLLGADGGERMPRAVRLTLVPYLTGGVLECVAGALNPVGMVLVAISAAAASFGGTCGLPWMLQLLKAPPARSPEAPPPRLGRSWGWIAAGALTAVLFIALLGPGVRFGGADSSPSHAASGTSPG